MLRPPFRRALSSLSRPQRSPLPAAQPCLAALLLVLPLAGPRPGPLAVRSARAPLSPAAPSRGRLETQPASLLGGYRLTPERRALLSTIRFAEGTWLGGSREGYRVLYGGGRFDDLRRHPEVEVRRRYVSAAAGAYQFLPQTWRAAARDLGLPDFGPASQDSGRARRPSGGGAADGSSRRRRQPPGGAGGRGQEHCCAGRRRRCRGVGRLPWG